MNKKDIISKIFNQKTINRIENKIKLLPTNPKLNVNNFLLMRLISSIVIFFVILFVSKFGYFLAPILTIIYYFLYEKVELDDKIKQRNILLEEEAIYFFEILTLSIETGRNLEGALNVTINSVDSTLSNEFKKTMEEVQFGKSLTEALVDMQSKISSSAINNIILTLTQADLFGSSIIKNLNEQIDYLREKKKLEIKGEITKVPIKISVISVLFFVPLVLLIILAPVILVYFG